MAEYPKTPASTVKRYAPRATYDAPFIHTLFNTTPILHVTFPSATSASPAILPMIGVVTTYGPSSSSPCLYLHGHASSRLFTTASPAAPIPVSACATRVDGLVLSLTPFSHSMNYRSAVIIGSGTVVTDPEEKLAALEAITEKTLAGRWENSRVPPTKSELTTTSVLRVEIEAASGKTREGGPGDERKDLRDEELVERVWTGVVPVVEEMLEPVPSSYCRGTVPSYIQEFVQERNGEGRKRAVEVAGKEY